MFPHIQGNQSGAFAKSYMRKGLLIYEEMRKYLVIYGETVSHLWLCTWSLLLIYEEKSCFLFYQCIWVYNVNRTLCTLLMTGWWQEHPAPPCCRAVATASNSTPPLHTHNSFNNIRVNYEVRLRWLIIKRFQLPPPSPFAPPPILHEESTII